MPNLDELLKNTPADVFASIWLSWRNTDLYFIHYTELLRLVALYKYGGVYLDTDIIVLKPLDGLHNVVGAENFESEKKILNGAIMVFNKSSVFLMECLTELTATYDEKLYDWNGAELLQRVVKNSTAQQGKSWWKSDEDLRIEPPLSFFPLTSHNIISYFATPSNNYDQEKELSLFKHIVSNAYTVHLWNHFTRMLIPEVGSIAQKILNYHCLRCDEFL